MQENNPLVSIGVASYNNSKYILETLESINRQTYPSIELIIVDDCSKDNSRDLIESWAVKSKFPLKIILNKENLGIPKVCNILLNAASAESKYLCLFSSDDLFTDDRIAKQVVMLEKSPETIVATFGDAEIIDDKGEKLLDSYYAMRGTEYSYFDDLFSKSDINHRLAEIIAQNRIPALTVMYRTEVIRSLGGWDEEYFIEDLDMNLKLIKAKYNFLPTKDILAKHRKHSSSVTTQMRVGYISSILEIVSKYKGINKEIDRSIGKNFREYALAVYERDGEKSAKFLKEKYNYDRNLKNLILYKIASLGIPFSRIRPIYNIFSKNATIKKQEAANV